jgi:hypothetical protein
MSYQYNGSPCQGCSIIKEVSKITAADGLKARASRCPCPLITDQLIGEVAQELGIDVSNLPRGISEVFGAMKFIAAQIENGDNGGSKAIGKHPVEDWVGTYISSDAISIACRLFGIKGFSVDPIFPDAIRLESLIDMDDHNYAMHFNPAEADLNRLYSFGYRGAEGFICGTYQFKKAAAPYLINARKKRLDLLQRHKSGEVAKDE